MKHIHRLIREGYITFSEDAENEFNEEAIEDEKEKDDNKEKEDEPKENKDTDALDKFLDEAAAIDKQNNENQENEVTNEDNWFDEDFNEEQQSQPPQDNFDEFDLQSQLDDITPPEDIEIEIEEPKVVKKIQTVDIVAKVIDKFDLYMNKVDVNTWNNIVRLGGAKVNKVTDWAYVEDVHKMINTVLGNQEFEYLNIYNNLYEKLTNKSWQRGLGIYGQVNYGKPWITEGLFLLIYELSFDWASFLVKFFVDTPEINPDDFENDSFVRKFPNLTLLTYIAKLVSESQEFDKFMTDPEVFKLMDDENEYNLTLGQVKKKKSLIKSAGESLTYYANLVKNNYADIVVGVLNKLGVVIYLHNNCKMSYNERLNLISQLIQHASSKKPLPISTEKVDNTLDKVEIVSPTDSLSGIKSLESKANDLILFRQEAMLLLESNKDNYIKITNE